MSDGYGNDAYGIDGYASDDVADEESAPAQERTFAALPPARGRGFAESWWGRAWVKALEDTALDGEQVKQGRRFAREGRVGAVSVRPGRITAVVQDRDSTAYRSDVLLQQLNEEEWDRFLDMAVDRAGHIAALLDREMPPHLVEDAAAAGVDLLPGIGDLDPECTCETWDHCPHSAALCYQVARLLDQDPFVLLLMRGRGERRLLDELQVRIAVRAAEREPAEPSAAENRRARGVRADETFAARDILPPLPAPPPLPAEPGPTPSLHTETEPEPGLDPAALEVLVTDSAVRAYRMLADALAPGHEQQPVQHELTPEQDAVRLVADARPEPWIVTRLSTGSGRQRAELDAAVRAWGYGGAAALAVLDEEWAPDPGSLARARARLAEAWEDGERPQLRAAGNRWTVAGGGVQLRYGRDGRWWPYRKERGRWNPAGPADDDPAAVLAGALGDGLAQVGDGGCAGDEGSGRRALQQPGQGDLLR
ncbi:SWF or SNF family helicase [Streptomyces sp. NBC_00841]|uniref:SWIM zinc finger family protein n=1 Tax=unclassified Streptomyces TaxID=2593676 RepID=UPI00225C3CB0|nr:MULTISPECIES: SWF or SNF family helicase [unclassified Streptomyces]MCX4530316.1 SWF or SNF family helicase [Streptomyces sp. NBC_01669]WSA03910.1 SWF or SNF family helicase [Streptomyces sp. NBC_00841]